VVAEHGAMSGRNLLAYAPSLRGSSGLPAEPVWPSRRCKTAGDLQPMVRALSLRPQKRPASTASASQKSEALPPMASCGNRRSRRQSRGNTSVSSEAKRLAGAVLSPSCKVRPAPLLRDHSNSSGEMSSDSDSVSRWTASSYSVAEGSGAAGVASRASSPGSSSEDRVPKPAGRRGRGLLDVTSVRSPFSATELPEEITCPRGHKLKQSHREKAWFCNCCGRISSQTSMERFRCNRCNYNICEQCFDLQRMDSCSPPPLLPESKLSQILRDDESLVSAVDDGTLSNLPPAFVRQMFVSAVHNTHGCKQIRPRSASPSTYAGEASTSTSTRRNSLASSASSRRPGRSSRTTWRSRSNAPDPMLRVCPLEDWFVESGLYERVRNVAPAREPASTPETNDPELFVTGHAFGGDHGFDLRRRFDRNYLEQLHNLAKCRFMPTNDVKEDLRIWHLTLLNRPTRRKLMNLGKVDGSARSNKGLDGGLRLGPSKRSLRGSLSEADVSTAASMHRSAMGMDLALLSRESRGPGKRGRGSKHASRRSSKGTAESSICARTQVPTAQELLAAASDFDGQSGMGPRGSCGKHLGHDGAGQLGQGNNRKGGGPGGAAPGKREASGAGGGEAHGDVDGGSPPVGGQDDEEKEEEGEEEERQKQASKILKGNCPGELGEGLDGRDVEESEEACGANRFFRIKAITREHAVADEGEFPRTLLPPPPLLLLGMGGNGESPAVGRSFSRPFSQSQGHGQGQGGANGENDDCRKWDTGSRLPPVVQRASVWSPGMRGRLADEFRRAIEEAWRPKVPLGRNSVLAGQGPPQASFLRDDELQGDRSRSGPASFGSEGHPGLPHTSSTAAAEEEGLGSRLEGLLRCGTADANGESNTLLEAHLKMRAGRYGKRLEAASGRAATAQGAACWNQRVDVCRRSVRSLTALSAFAEHSGNQHQFAVP